MKLNVIEWIQRRFNNSLHTKYYAEISASGDFDCDENNQKYEAKQEMEPTTIETSLTKHN